VGPYRRLPISFAGETISLTNKHKAGPVPIDLAQMPIARTGLFSGVYRRSRDLCGKAPTASHPAHLPEHLPDFRQNQRHAAAAATFMSPGARTAAVAATFMSPSAHTPMNKGDTSV
jgi:hypothetical protein